MRKAFWDGIIESVEQNEPDFGRIIELMKEVRDEISGMAPESWKGEISEVIDLDIISQVLIGSITSQLYCIHFVDGRYPL